MLKVSNSSHLTDSAVQNISAPTTAPANKKTSTTANTPGVQTTAEPATTNQTKNYASADTAAKLLHFDTSTLEAASATGMASQTPMQIAQHRTLSLQEKKAAALQAKQLRQDLQTFSLIAQLGTPGQTPLQRTRTMLTLANNTNNLRARDFVRLSNQLNLYENRGHRLTPEALETFNTQLKSALETGAQHRAAFQLFDKGGLVNDLYQIIQLGDIKPLQNASAALKERIGTSTESLYQYGEGGQLAAVLTEMTANTAVDIFFPTNLLDVTGLGLAARKGLSKAGSNMNALFKDIAESQKVSGIYYDANRQLQIGEVNLLKEAAKLNPQQRKVLILIKLADLADAKKSGDYQKVLKIAAELHDPRAKDTLADLVVEQLIRFGSGNLPLASASYQGAAHIENSQTVTETRAALQTFFHDTFQSIVD